MINKKVVVTGGAGFIGSHLVLELLGLGAEVHVVDNFAGGKKPERIQKCATYHEVDIRDTEALIEICRGAEIIFHLAALPRVQYSIRYPEETNDVNVNGTLSVILAAKEAGVKRIVYSASSSAYGDQKHLPLHEGLMPNPKSPYGMQKYYGEVQMRVASEVWGIETVSLRYFNVYGHGSDPNGAYALVIAKFLRMKQDGKPLTITGDGTQTRDFTHVSDVVRANILASQSEKVGKGEVINIGAGNNVSVNRIAELIGGPIEYVEARLEPQDTLANNSRAKKLLEWEPMVDIEIGITNMINNSYNESHK